MIQKKSVTEPRTTSDGYRILIEPVWPKGLPKGKAGGVDWAKQLYPSHNLQDWMRRNPRKKTGFTERYLLELAQKDEEMEMISRLHAERGNITIVVPAGDDPWGIYDTLLRWLGAACDV